MKQKEEKESATQLKPLAQQQTLQL